MTTRRWIFFLISLAVGLGAGLIYGWVVSPVQYVDTISATLRSDYRTDYVLMVAEVYQNDQNVDVAARRLASLGRQSPADSATQALTFAQQNGYNAGDIALIQNLTSALQVWQPDVSKP